MRLCVLVASLATVLAYSLHDLNNNEYTWEVSGCQNQLIRAEPSVKYIVSSSFPNIYGQKMDCTWKIQAPLGKVVEITFPTFHVDFCDSSGVKVYNGPKSEATLAVEHCGLDNPDPFRSSGQMVSVQAYQKQTSQGYGLMLMIGYQAVTKGEAAGRTQSIYHNNYQPQQISSSSSLYPQLQSPLVPSNSMLVNQNANLLNQLGLLNSVAKQYPTFNNQRAQNQRTSLPKKIPKKAPHKKPQPKPKPKPIVINTSGTDNFQRLKAKREYERKQEQDLLKRKLIIVIVILILIISGNIWFIWYRRTLERTRGTDDGKGPNGLNNADRNSFTSKAPVLENDDSLYCSLDEVR